MAGSRERPLFIQWLTRGSGHSRETQVADKKVLSAASGVPRASDLALRLCQNQRVQDDIILLCPAGLVDPGTSTRKDSPAGVRVLGSLCPVGLVDPGTSTEKDSPIRRLRFIQGPALVSIGCLLP